MGLLLTFDAEAPTTSGVLVTSGYSITFDGDPTVFGVNLGTATEAIIEGGPRGFQGLQGWSAYEVWRDQPGNEAGTVQDYLNELIGSDGAPGPSGYIVYNSGTSTYPARPIVGQPVTFVGPVSPLDVPVTMINDDVWINTTPDAVNNTVYVAVADLDGRITTVLTAVGPTSAFRTALDTIISAAITAQASKPKEVRFSIQTGQTAIDEFDASTINLAWNRVDGSNPERVTWVQGGGFLVAKSTATADAAALLHGMMRLGSLEIGEALETYVRLTTAQAASSPMLGLCVSDGITAGAGTQVSSRFWTNSTDVNLSVMRTTGWSVEQAAGNSVPAIVGVGNPWRGSQNGVYLRLVRTASLIYETQFSYDGISWLRQNAHTVPAAFTPTYVGFWSCTWTSAFFMAASFDYLRKVTP